MHKLQVSKHLWKKKNINILPGIEEKQTKSKAVPNTMNKNHNPKPFMMMSIKSENKSLKKKTQVQDEEYSSHTHLLNPWSKYWEKIIVIKMGNEGGHDDDKEIR